MIDQLTWKSEDEVQGKDVGPLIVEDRKSNYWYTMRDAQDIADLFDVELVVS